MARYIELRYNTWHCYLAVPKDVRSVLGTSRFYKSLQTNDKKKAEILALMQVAEWKQQIADARIKTPEFIKRANEIAISGKAVDMQEISEIADINDQKAEEFYKIASREEIFFRPNLDGFIDNLTSQKYANETIDRYKSDVIFFFDKFSKLSEVNTRAIRDWIKVLRAEGKTDGSIKRILTKGTAKFFKYIEYKFDIVIDVDLSVPKFDINPSQTTDRKDIDDAGIAKIYNQLIIDKDYELLNFFKIACYTGMRINEIGDIKKKDIKVIDGIKIIDINESKTNAGIRKIPVSRWIDELIEDLCKNKKDDDYLFDISRDAKRPTGAIGARFSRLKVSLGFGEDITFHSTRHRLDTYLLREGIDDKIVSQIMGHSIKGNESRKTYYQGAHLQQLKQAIDIVRCPPLEAGSLLHLFE